jgi:hypothetical protein
MKRTMLAPLALMTTLSLGGAAMAKEDKPGPDWMPADQVKQRLMDVGYSSITELEADDGHWEGESLKNGAKTEFHVDPRTGAITKEQADDD